MKLFDICYKQELKISMILFDICYKQEVKISLILLLTWLFLSFRSVETILSEKTNCPYQPKTKCDID